MDTGNPRQLGFEMRDRSQISIVFVEVAERAITSGIAIAPHRCGERIEAALPVIYGGATIGAVAARWTLGSTYDRSAVSFDNADFVDVVIHSYRHRMGNAPGDPQYAALEERLAKLPKINVPTIVLHGRPNDVVLRLTSSETVCRRSNLWG